MSDALIFNLPIELSLKHMAVISPDFPDAEREFFDDVIDELVPGEAAVRANDPSVVVSRPTGMATTSWKTDIG